MSEAGLVFQRQHAQASCQQLLDQVHLFVVVGRAAQRSHGLDMVDRDAGGLLLDEIGVAGLLDQGAMRSKAQSSGFSSQRSLYGARYLTVVSRCGLATSWSVLAPLGHSPPWLTGLRGSPSMLTIWPFLV